MLHLASLISLFSAGAVIAGVLAGATGCTEPSEVTIGVAEQHFDGCTTKWECGSNSPVLATYRFHELNTRGLPNEEGFSVLGLWQGSVRFNLSVEEGRITGQLGSLQLQGAALENAQIRVQRGPQTFAIRIARVGGMLTFAKVGGVRQPLETYLLDMSELFGDAPPTGWRNLCSNPPSRETPGLSGMNVYHTLVYEGERIDPATKTLYDVGDRSWFNLGCAGHAISKMAINGQTVAGRSLGFETTVDERQAFLKMLTGDYCGNGHPFTVPGQRLQWADSNSYTDYTLPAADLELEARWTAQGASCLNVPRVEANPTAQGDATFPMGVIPTIQASCMLPPPCVGSVGWFGGASVLSANPI